ncbi:hypothetical protein [Schlesneria paludicola]|uniref:hypothetical protein n=1 Tax=Schlesneria paludicola TaxID=360056 RepID=UPI000299E0DF|nr:hypothetical protein [Schlesneria paludicola]
MIAWTSITVCSPTRCQSRPAAMGVVFVAIWFVSAFSIAAAPPQSDSKRTGKRVVTALMTTDETEGRLLQVSDVIAVPKSDDRMPQPLNAAPPPDPETPAWGRFDEPLPSAAPLPAIEYSLIGPPTGIIQHSDEQEYRAVVSDPNTVFDYDSRIGQSIDLQRPDGIAPIGVFGDHTLPAGKAFISYRYLQNTFEQNYVGSHRSGVPTGYPFSPTRMMQNSQVVQIEYGATNDWTVIAQLPFDHNEISYQTATNYNKATFTNPGDIRIMGLYVMTRGVQSQSHLSVGLNLPVGFLETQTVMPSATDPNLPYQLRTSSGTYDLLLGYTYRRQTDCWTWGGQANAVIPTGKNTLNYELGNQVELTTWVSRRWTEQWSTSARLDGRLTENIHGADGRLDPALSPVNQANAQATRSVSGLLGVNYLLSRPEHRIREQRLFLESGIPFYQWVDGQQLGLSWTLNAGWGMMF